jgi:hypothetical protein
MNSSYPLSCGNRKEDRGGVRFCASPYCYLGYDFNRIMRRLLMCFIMFLCLCIKEAQ